MILGAEARRPDKKMLKNIVRCMGVVSAPGACMGMDASQQDRFYPAVGIVLKRLNVDFLRRAEGTCVPPTLMK
jgi:hypothetical protein